MSSLERKSFINFLVVTASYYKRYCSNKKAVQEPTRFWVLSLCFYVLMYLFILHSECKSCNFGGKNLLSKQIDFVNFVMKIVLNFKFERTESFPLRCKECGGPLCTASVMDVFSMSSNIATS